MSHALPQADQLAASGRVADAAAVLEQAAAAGDGSAAFVLAHWRLSGDLIRRDLALARAYFLHAADLGVAEAEGCATALLANGAGGSRRQWKQALERLRDRQDSDPHAAQQLKLLAAMPLDAQGEHLGKLYAEPLNHDPAIALHPRFLSNAECAYLIDLALPRLQPAGIVHPQSGQIVLDPVRSSTVAAFPFIDEDPVVHAINRRIARATGTTYEQGEPIQILSYQPGQQYKLHSDALAGEANQRVLTFLVYLSDDYDGGETVFPDLKLTVRGRPGEGLMFRNVDSEGHPHPLARHAGLPVTRGRKLLVSKWIRANPLDLSGPPGRPL